MFRNSGFKDKGVSEIFQWFKNASDGKEVYPNKIRMIKLKKKTKNRYFGKLRVSE